MLSIDSFVFIVFIVPPILCAPSISFSICLRHLSFDEEV